MMLCMVGRNFSWVVVFYTSTISSISILVVIRSDDKLHLKYYKWLFLVRIIFCTYLLGKSLVCIDMINYKDNICVYKHNVRIKQEEPLSFDCEYEVVIYGCRLYLRTATYLQYYASMKSNHSLVPKIIIYWTIGNRNEP